AISVTVQIRPAAERRLKVDARASTVAGIAGRACCRRRVATHIRLAALDEGAVAVAVAILADGAVAFGSRGQVRARVTARAPRLAAGAADRRAAGANAAGDRAPASVGNTGDARDAGAAARFRRTARTSAVSSGGRRAANVRLAALDEGA